MKGADAERCSQDSRSGDWQNWSGSLRFRPAHVERPRTEQEVVALVQRAIETKTILRPVGASHSSSTIYRTEGTLVSTEHLAGVIAVDRECCEATLRAGTMLESAFKKVRAEGLSPPDLGDIAMQTIGGSIVTGTHGSGKRLGNLSTMLIGGRLVTGTGKTIAFSAENDADLLRALRVSLGAFGILTEVRLKLEPAYRLRRQEWFADVGGCMEHLQELFERNRKFDFYWYPRSDEVKLRILNRPGEGMSMIDWAVPVHDREDWADKIIPKHSGLTNLFDETEYALPAEAGPACFLEVRRRILERHRADVGWRVLYRMVAADDADLSTAHGRDSVEISLHQNAGRPWKEFFADIEPIFRAHGGRPHWAKKHNLTAKDLRPLYPQWDHFLRIRRQFDPHSIFLSADLKELFGLGEEA